MLFYLLRPDHTVYKADNNIEWARVMSVTPNRVARDDLPNGGYVSTVFMGLDHGGGDKLELFETMVFDGVGGAGATVRYATWDEAVAGHRNILNSLVEHPAIAALHDLQATVREVT